MSVIAIHMIREELPVRAALRIARATGESIASVRGRARAGGRCLLRRELFLNDHEDVASLLLFVIGVLEEYAVAYELLECAIGEKPTDAHRAHHRLCVEVLMNILTR
ncbi:MAG: hypothetical protein H6722_22340 [Sandaracinus sp.]|nr:hypothetical protein [Sandaracinus sp.]